MNPSGIPHKQAAWHETDLENLLRKTPLNWIDYQTSKDLLRLSGLERDSETLIPLLLSLFLVLNEGSLCLELDEEKLRKRLDLFTDFGSHPATAAEVLKSLRAHRWDALVATDPEAYLPLRIHREGSREFLYFQKYDSKEQQLAADFGALLSSPDDVVNVETIKEILEETLEKSPVRREAEPIELNLQQRIGICLSLIKKVAIISGGPGTGKTSIVVALLRALARLGTPVDRIRLAAPTGRAANRMSESIRSALASIENPSKADRELEDLEGMTLHRLLKYRGGKIPFWHHRYNPIPADLIVVDEVSMVDVCLMSDLLAAIRPGTRLILLGDKDQLPSVEAGAVLGNLIPDLVSTYLSEDGRALIEDLLGTRVESTPPSDKGKMADRVVLLDRSYRSEETILNLAARINHGDRNVVAELKDHELPVRSKGEGIEIEWPVPALDGDRLRCPGGGFRWIDSSGTNPAHWEQVLNSWVDHRFVTSERGVRKFLGLVKRPVPNSIEGDEETLKRLKDLFEWLDRSRILCLVRKGFYGVEWINRHVGRRMRKQTSPGTRGELFPGLPILILRNDLTLGVFNGDVGVLLPNVDRSLRAYFTRGDSFVSCPLSSLPHFEPAYALTVHKSQGSEYDQVLLVLPEDPEHRLLSREMVYTGLTRAKNLAVVYGKEECLSAAIGRKIDRESGRNLWGM